MCEVICFDLDDTLHKEINYLKAAYRLIALEVFGNEWDIFYHQMIDWYNSGFDVFAKVVELAPNVKKSRLLDIYRYEVHTLCLPLDVESVLISLKDEGVHLGLITDGRSVSQRNKIAALGLNRFFHEDMIIISEEFGSEKPAVSNYKYFMDKYPRCINFTYVGDNPQKDFIAANFLGWTSVCILDNGENIHKQDFNLIPQEAKPKKIIASLSELI